LFGGGQPTRGAPPKKRQCFPFSWGEVEIALEKFDDTGKEKSDVDPKKNDEQLGQSSRN